MKNLVSIIVPNYNHSKFLEQRIESILNQTYQNFELILLDDASTDNSIEILKKYSKNKKVSHLLISNKNSGSPFMQWNKGLKLAKGDYVWIAESDDFCKLTFLEELINFNLEYNNQLDVLYCQSLDVDEDGKNAKNRIYYTADFSPNIWENDFIIEGSMFIENYLKVKCIIPNASAVLFKRELFNNNILDKDHLKMKICGDWLFWIKLVNNKKVGFLNKSLNKFRYHSNVTRNQKTQENIYNRYYEEKIVRDYLTNNFKVEQFDETQLLYKKWFKKNAIKMLLSKKYYSVKLKETSIFSYIRYYFKIHKTKEKLLNKLKL